MRVQSYLWNGVTATVYWLDKGEKVARHQHPNEHTTVPLFGMTRVDIYDGREPVMMIGGNPNLTLPANIDHEVTALEDGTIIMHMVAGDVSSVMAVTAEAGQDGGVELEAA